MLKGTIVLFLHYWPYESALSHELVLAPNRFLPHKIPRFQDKHVQFYHLYAGIM